MLARNFTFKLKRAKEGYTVGYNLSAIEPLPSEDPEASETEQVLRNRIEHCATRREVNESLKLALKQFYDTLDADETQGTLPLGDEAKETAIDSEVVEG